MGQQASHVVAILASQGVIAYDLAIPCDVFGRAQLADDAAAYEVRVCGVAPRIESHGFGIVAPYGLAELARADTVIVPGTDDLSSPVPVAVTDALAAAFARGARIASICTGSFILAATGLLAGRRATTHWRAAPLLAERFPEVTVDPGVLFVDEGRIVSSAGSSAGLDMCLHLLRRDHGHAIAAQAARMAVAPLDREGGQAQFIRHEPPGSTASLAPLLAWMEQNAHRPLRLDELAVRARMSERTLARRFREQTGTTPLQWLLMARVRRAQELLETTALSIDQVAAAAGFDSASSLRARFQRMLGVSPRHHRRAFGASAAGMAA